MILRVRYFEGENLPSVLRQVALSIEGLSIEGMVVQKVDETWEIKVFLWTTS